MPWKPDHKALRRADAMRKARAALRRARTDRELADQYRREAHIRSMEATTILAISRSKVLSGIVRQMWANVFTESLKRFQNELLQRLHDGAEVNVDTHPVPEYGRSCVITVSVPTVVQNYRITDLDLMMLRDVEYVGGIPRGPR